MIEETLFTSLLNVLPRIYPLIMPDDAVFPAIVYTVVSDNSNQATNGNLTSRTVRFQVDIYSKSYADAKGLKDLVISEVIGLRGGSISAQDLYEDELELHRQLIDFSIKRT